VRLALVVRPGPMRQKKGHLPRKFGGIGVRSSISSPPSLGQRTLCGYQVSGGYKHDRAATSD
jgi:hypothetical protein